MREMTDVGLAPTLRADVARERGSKNDATRGGSVARIMDYAGDVGPKAAWDMLSCEPGAVLVDCRSRVEWMFVGVADLSPLGKRAALVEWQMWPSMTQNPNFAEQISAAAPDRDAPVVFLCRSGARSKAAAMHMTSLGYRRCYNLEGGFEGPLDGARHRGAAAGWKAAGLPWFQE